ncbi:sigma-54 dependent DNA-binding response regulator [Desulforapulum autotrophicum HRM2]|uniref:Sigma-54 dependent DNA-binding response regulator n=1 Tax=Desulforapulum autotrophicum (strain ATCC 43914 / DSM 3382 / VKM B-1955 / HRM2) TaxID=177437 RepID=C0Q920_DESAH|nr:sigma-54 dependent transcriptional regulator [Desulforapulum autotrophicum]ACN16525.1 sigma-54 dependent DNA-binding response regulator [Desulforapulum autotrophicum HRM2]
MDKKKMPKVLIIDDNEQVCKFLIKLFSKTEYQTFYQLTLKEGLENIFSDDIDIVFLDVNLPDGNGLEAIDIIKQHPAAPEIIIITADGNVDGAELAMRSKAWDYIPKTESNKNFKFALDRALEYRKQKQFNQLKKKIKRARIIGDSRLISKCLDDVSKAANSDIPVLITGKTGTGKELFSRAIHTNSNRSRAGFVVVDCAALPEHLVESTLFGHTKGAFTGADSDKPGLMKMADKGTLFLDEIGELPLTVQKKFLRALQGKEFRPVGGKNEVKSDFRLICATHRDLSNMVKENKFREDLYFRIFSMNIQLPRLKDREDDAAKIAQCLMTQKTAGSENSCTMSQEFLEEIRLYDWPGNVRELITTINLACSDAGSDSTLFPYHLPDHIRAFNIKNKFNTPDSENTTKKNLFLDTKRTGKNLKFKAYIEQMKYDYLQELLSAAKGDIKKSCRRSGLSRSQLYRLLQQYKIKTVTESNSGNLPNSTL